MLLPGRIVQEEQATSVAIGQELGTITPLVNVKEVEDEICKQQADPQCVPGLY